MLPSKICGLDDTVSKYFFETKLNLKTVVGICSSKQVLLQKFCKFHRKALVLESPFNKVAVPQARKLLFTEHL